MLETNVRAVTCRRDAWAVFVRGNPEQQTRPRQDMAFSSANPIRSDTR